MCGIIGYIGQEAAAPLIQEGLAFLQHRGQDSTGIATMRDDHMYIEKNYGIARDAFDDAKIASLQGAAGIGHVRYTTQGGARVLSEVQPFYVNQPYGITLAHNGNLTNHDSLCHSLAHKSMRHINSVSDSEALLNTLADCVFAQGLPGARSDGQMPSLLFSAVAELHRRAQGAYSVVVLIAGAGLLAFRDPHGIRPLSLGSRHQRREWLAASENVVFRPLGFADEGDIAPGEAVFVDMHGQMHRRQCSPRASSMPCIFEYIYFARPDSVIDGVSVYEARMNMGRYLAKKIRRQYAELPIDCVIPVPDSGRVAAMELARELDIPYREGLVKNRYVGRTFIASGRALRRRSVREKINVIETEFSGKNVLLVDDSIVRGTTSRELVNLARSVNARRVYLASAAPQVLHPNVYGINISSTRELIASGRTDAEIASSLGADCVIYQSLPDLTQAMREINGGAKNFETSCFDGIYPVGEIDHEYLAKLDARHADGDASQLDLVL